MKKMAFVFFVWAVGLYTIAYFADLFLVYDPSFPYADALLPSFEVPRWIYSWANFDGIHYLTIVEKGYVGTGLIQAFFPVYPGLIMFDTFVGINPLISGQLLSLAAFFGVMVVWQRLVSVHFSKRIAGISLTLLMLFPTSFFFMALYTESLFLLLVLLSLYAAAKKQWIVAIAMAAIASGTKIVGIALLPTLVLEYLLQKNIVLHLPLDRFLRSLRKLRTADYVKLAAIIFSGTGLFLYMLFLNQEFHDPFYFFHVQEEFGGGRSESFILFPQVVYRYLKILTTVEWHSWSYFAFAQEFLWSMVTLGVLVWAWVKKYRPSYLVFGTLVFLIPTLTGTFSSMPRYILACFPLFIGLAEYLEPRPKLRFAWYVVSSILLILNTVLFIQGYWVA